MRLQELINELELVNPNALLELEGDKQAGPMHRFAGDPSDLAIAPMSYCGTRRSVADVLRALRAAADTALDGMSEYPNGTSKVWICEYGSADGKLVTDISVLESIVIIHAQAKVPALM